MADVVFALEALAHRDAEAAAGRRPVGPTPSGPRCCATTATWSRSWSRTGTVRWISEGVDRPHRAPAGVLRRRASLSACTPTTSSRSCATGAARWPSPRARPSPSCAWPTATAAGGGARSARPTTSTTPSSRASSSTSTTSPRRRRPPTRRGSAPRSWRRWATRSWPATSTGCITYMNEAALALGGWELDDVDRADRCSRPCPSRARTSSSRSCGSACTPRSRGRASSTYHLPDGAVPMLVTNTPIVRDGEVVGMIGVAADISARVAAEARLGGPGPHAGRGGAARAAGAAQRRHRCGGGRRGRRRRHRARRRRGDARRVGRPRTGSWSGRPGATRRHRARRAAPEPGAPRSGRRSAWPAATRCWSRTSPPTPASRVSAPDRARHATAAAPSWRWPASQAFHGSLVALSHERRTFDPDEVSFVEALANVRRRRASTASSPSRSSPTSA